MSAHYDDPRDAERLAAIRGYRFKASENMLGEETVFLLNQIDTRDAALREAHDLLPELLPFAKDATPPLQARVAKALAEVDGGGK